jgi:toxin ParE1/3/4
MRWHDDMYLHFRNLGQMPGLGVSRDSLRRGLMLFPVGKYLILYRKVVDGIEIVRVIHGARDLRKLL